MIYHANNAETLGLAVLLAYGEQIEPAEQAAVDRFLADYGLSADLVGMALVEAVAQAVRADRR